LLLKILLGYRSDEEAISPWVFWFGLTEQLLYLLSYSIFET